MTEPTGPRQYNDDEVNGIVAKAKRDEATRARAARDAELAEQWGMPVDQVKQIVDKAKSDADARKTEADRAREAADLEKTAASKERAEAAQLRHVTRIERALLVAGVPAGDDELLADAAALVRVAPDGDADAVKDAVEKLKGRHPSMFTGTVAPAVTPTVVPDPGRAPTGRPATGQPGGRSPQVSQQLARRGIKVAS